MKQERANSVSSSHSRCRHFTANGRQCRLRILDAATGLCFRHASLQDSTCQDVDLSAAFPGQLDEFKSAIQINGFLATLAALVVQNRISPRRAAVLAFITNQLLRTLPAIEHELYPSHEKNAVPPLIFEPPYPLEPQPEDSRQEARRP